MKPSAMQPGPRRYLALWFPYLSCERTRSTATPTPPEPLVLVARAGSALRLSAVDAAALALGLEPGMTLADARARCPSLAALPVDPTADAHELARLVAEMRRFSPMVSADPPDGIVIDITGCAHLFGGEAKLAQRAVGRAGYAARHALAPHAATARALARYGGKDANVLALPVSALELEEEAVAAMSRAGLHTIGDLAQRPMLALAARFGTGTVMRLRRIIGEISSPIIPYRASAPVHCIARFAEPLLHAEDVLEAIEQLLVQAGHQMEARQIGGRRFVVILLRSDNARRQLAVETGRPAREPAPVMRLLRERIETLADPLDPGFGFDAVALRVMRTEHLLPRQMALEEAEEERTDSFAALLDRLGVRFGADRIRRLASCDRHLPEKAQALVLSAPARASPWPLRKDRPPRPLLLFDPPQPVEAIAGVPDGPPQRFRWQGRVHEVRLTEGPERVGAEWWSKPGGHLPGNAGLTRDYYRIEDGEGCRYWIFRHGLFEESSAPRWYLHGMFP